MSAGGSGGKDSTTSNQNRKAREKAAKAELAVQLLRGAGAKKIPKTSGEHKFWNTQPVPKLEENPKDFGPIDEPKSIDDVDADPLKLPDGFRWVNIDVNDEDEIKEMYKLLSKHYVEDDDNMFRFDYSKDFLLWALQPPGWLKTWHVGIRTEKDDKLGPLVACITATPADINVYTANPKEPSVVPMVEINFLCVHKKLRCKRLAPVLIREVTRRVNRAGRWQAVYTAGVVLPRPLAKNRYYHRSLNPRKLIDIGFSRRPPKLTMQSTVRLYKLPEAPLMPGFRELRESDIPHAHILLNNYLKNFKVHTRFSVEDFAHWFTPREDVINCYVIEDPKTKQPTDLVSFYTLPSSVIGNKKYPTMKAAYSFYNVCNTVSWKELMKDAMIMAQTKGFDVYNALNVMENEKFLKDLNFGIGDGQLQYYFFNWKCPEVESGEVGIVLL